ncbi:tRNA pseudouridine(38-40) synthase TruA [bacterium]|nr:tRNA pseudouridine(38-40) synthase TruA [bacterium]
MMIARTIRLSVSYDGSNYAGWQVQPKQRTIQGVLEDSLKFILNETCRLIGAGRTDAGVHALCQVAHFKTNSKIPTDNIKMALNSILPKDIAVIDTFETLSEFHARKNALSKKYIYRIHRGKTRDPFLWPYTWHFTDDLDLDNIRACMSILRGEHDFSSFSVLDRDTINGTRKLIKLELIEENDILTFEFVGNGFLRKQIRRIVGTLIRAGRGCYTPEQISQILLSRDPTQAGPTAPPKGLFLVKVNYLPSDNEDFIFNNISCGHI